MCIIYDELTAISCYAWPYFWPGWVGGNPDFLRRGQPFNLIVEMRHATMLEF